MKQQKTKKDLMKEILEQLEKYEEGTPPKKAESCCSCGGKH